MTKILVDSELLEQIELGLRVDNYAPNWANMLRAALDAPQQEAVAWMLTNKQSGDVEVAWDTEGFPRELWQREPLYAHPAPSVPEGWQPISTAPKDGTKLLLCIEGFEASTGCFHPDFGRWTTFPIDEFEEKEWERWFDENEYKPTFWMRLPTLSAAPKAPTTDDRKDAERWRYIRRNLCLTGNGDGTCQMHALNLPRRIQGWPEIGESLQFHDAAIDAAIAAQKEQCDAKGGE